jgi:DNA-binding transcriptional MerR regulator
MKSAKREVFKSPDVCEMTQLQPYVLRSWEAEFPSLGRPAGTGSGRLYRRADIELVLRIKQLVFGEGLTLAGARRRLEEEGESPTPSPVAVEEVFGDMARTRLRQVRAGLVEILELVSRDGAGALSVDSRRTARPADRAPARAAARRSRPTPARSDKSPGRNKPRKRHRA